MYMELVTLYWHGRFIYAQQWNLDTSIQIGDSIIKSINSVLKTKLPEWTDIIKMSSSIQSQLSEHDQNN